jgi:hypothetical protein
MKYMLLIYNNSQTIEEFSPEEREQFMGVIDPIMKELTESGELVGGEGLADASTAKTVRVRDGVPAVTDGPFVEAKEAFAGYLAVDCESEARAIEIAASWPDASLWAMEVRALMGSGGEEM